MKSKIIVRVRRIDALKTNGIKESVRILDGHRLMVDEKRVFTVDHVLGPSSGPDDILGLCEEDIEQFMNGSHLTIVLYGQVGQLRKRDNSFE
jgi:hypothetical protein